MNVKLPKNLIIFCCVFFIVAGLSSKVTGQEEKSVLNRIQRIDNPELGELIRIALENFSSPEFEELKLYEASNSTSQNEYKKIKSLVQAQKLNTVRKVTEEYSEIKLLDSQIEQIKRRINLSGSPETLANELFLAKTELEAKLTNKLAELRVIMNIIPIHPLGRRSVEQLNTWIELDVTGEQVAVFTCSKPFNEYIHRMKHNFIKLISHKEAFDYVKNNLKNLPVRIDISRNTEGIKLSEELNKQFIDFIKDKNLEMQAEVHLDDKIRTQSEGRTLFIQDGKIGQSISTGHTTKDDKTVTIKKLKGIVDPNQINETIQSNSIRLPGLLPQEISLLRDEKSKDMALSVEEKINNFAKENGLEKVLTVRIGLFNLNDDQ